MEILEFLEIVEILEILEILDSCTCDMDLGISEKFSEILEILESYTCDMDLEITDILEILEFLEVGLSLAPEQDSEMCGFRGGGGTIYIYIYIYVCVCVGAERGAARFSFGRSPVVVVPPRCSKRSGAEGFAASVLTPRS